MTIIAIVLLSFAFLLNLLKKPIEKEIANKIASIKIHISRLGVAIYDGMFGPGQATLLMYSHLQNGYRYIQAIAYTRFQTFVSCLGAFIMYVNQGLFDVRLGLFLAIGSFIGAQVAVRIAHKLPPKHVRFLLNFITLLLIIQLYMKIFL